MTLEMKLMEAKLDGERIGEERARETILSSLGISKDDYEKIQQGKIKMTLSPSELQVGGPNT